MTALYEESRPIEMAETAPPTAEAPAGRSGRRLSARARLAWRVGALALLLLAWQVASGRWLPAYAVSDPIAIGQSLISLVTSGQLWDSLSITLEEMALGLVLGGLAGIVVGLALGWFTRAAEVLDPFLISLYALPKLALAPLLILWFGIGLEMKTLLTAAIVFFLMLWNVLGGMRAVDRQLVDVVRVMGANTWQLLFKVMLPASMEWIYVGLKISLPYSVVGAVVGEMLASNRGIGYLILRASGNFDPATLFAALIILMLLTAALNECLSLSERYVLRWRK